LVYADDIVLGGSVHNIKKNKEALIVPSTEIGLEANDDTTTCTAMYRDQNARRSHKVKIYKFPFKGGSVKIFRNNCNESKYHSGRN
jgi:hypothetical protein